uniref:Uncharacterized protein n=1 Tax=Photinus pyralis TaxID=7054 RepID=A0A1Y1MWL0_PHOPY
MMNIHPLKLASRYSRFINLTFRNFSRDSTISSQKSSNGLLKYDCNQQFKIHKNSISVSVAVKGSAARAETTTTTQGLSKLQAQELILRLNSEERTLLYSALQEYQSKLIKDEYQGQLAASRWRSKFGRPSKLPRLGDVDPTGSYCLLPEDWLMKKCGRKKFYAAA